MCVAMPGRVLEVHDDGGTPMATVDQGGVPRPVCLAFCPEVRVGDHVVVHLGFAVSVVDPDEAAATLAMLAGADRPEVPDDPGPMPVGSQAPAF